MPEAWNHVIVRDGRPGRDPALVTEDGGEVLDEYELEDYRAWKIGDRLTLPDGFEVEVIAVGESLVATRAVTTLTIGNAS
jgi:hypothetical protein